MSELFLGIQLGIASGDVLGFAADVLVLKHAQSLYGVDEAVVARLRTTRPEIFSELPEDGKYLFIDSDGAVTARSLLFIGVGTLRRFRYQEIRVFGRRLLRALEISAPACRSISLTLHGPGYGLDEAEAFRSEIGGLIDGISEGRYPHPLERITIVEGDKRRAERLQRLLREIIPSATAASGEILPRAQQSREVAETLRSVGSASEAKRHVFVAMPFVEEMADTFHYGIEPAVKDVVALCERADQAVFTGEIMAWVQNRIRTAQFLVADLSGANPNVYLEVGYAWGCGVPTILVVRDSSELKFDVKGQRCIVYRSIRELEERLRRELRDLARHDVF